MEAFISFIIFFQLHPAVVYASTALLAFVAALPGIGLLIPITPLILVGGYISGNDFANALFVIIVFSSGTMVGEIASFLQGRHDRLHPQQVPRVFRSRFYHRSAQFLKRHGVSAILFGRFLWPYRAFLAYVAGRSHNQPQTFFFWNFFSVIAWVSALSGVGFFAATAWEVIVQWSTRISLVAIVGAFFYGGVLLITHIVVRRAKRFFHFIWSLLRSIASALWTNPEVIKIAAHYPRFGQFLAARCSRKKFFGLPLTLFILWWLFVATQLVGVIIGIMTGGTTAVIDENIENVMSLLRNSGIGGFFLLLGIVGRGAVIASMIALYGMVLAGTRRGYEAVRFLLGAFVTGGTILMLRSMMHRIHPASSIVKGDFFSFPNTASALGVFLLGNIIFFEWRITKKRFRPAIVFSAISIGLVLMGSQLYLNVAFLSDVIAGVLVGLLGCSVSGALCLVGGRCARMQVPRISPIAYFLALAIASAIFLTALIFDAPSYAPQVSRESTRIASKDPANLFEGDLRLSRYVETLKGVRQEPLSLLILANNDEVLEENFAKAGWHRADEVDTLNLFHALRAALFDAEYETAPITPEFWNSNVQDFGFEKSTDRRTIRERHHARIWKTPYLMADGKKIYVGSASFDKGVKWGITHSIDPDLDTERMALLQDLRTSGSVVRFENTQFVKPLLGKNFSGDRFFTNGTITLIEIQ